MASGRDDGQPAASGLARFGWAMFDWANQPLFTLISTFIFAPYFATKVVGNPVEGQVLWGYLTAIAGLVIALLSPLLGAIADQSGPRKPWIAGFQLLSVVGAAALWFAVPNAPDNTMIVVMLAIVLLTIGAECSIVFNNAMLPGLAPERRVGRLSGSAWALGYVGGLICLVFVLLAFSLPEKPLFGLDKAAHEHDRIVGPLTAVWIVLFMLPLYLFTPDAPRRGRNLEEAAHAGVDALIDTVKGLRHYRNIVVFLLGRMASYDGLNALFAFGGIYAAGIFGWTTTELGLFGIMLNVVAAVGAYLGGRADDRFGSKLTIQLATIGLTVAALGIVSMTRDSVLFGVAVDGPAAGGALFASTAERVFLLFGLIIGICGGPMQAASRTLMARLAPPEMVGEFYGLHALSGKATAFLAPWAIAIATDAFGSQRAGMTPIIVLLVIGFCLTALVREERAVKVSPA